ncbi:glycosyltransferase family 4 protein [Chitinophaga lutea]|uniref:Glycosyltransferase family 4 protein n=1 Tax=Chitinophaga lutea TaxID=2488634 RepID=A0A3N4QB76_9BACT|nr:glycosyltransferase family 4 protein [Chitinophaga lutea]RPE13240.1 glycosyltransferase family 4 protein [Chitinophaga lutea]
MKRLLFIIYSLENPRGTERVTTTLANELCRHSRYEITIATLYGCESYFPLDEQVKVCHLEKQYGHKSKVRKASYLIEMINKGHWDYVIGEAMNLMTFFCAYLTYRVKVPVKFIIHEHTSFNNAGRIMRLLKIPLYKRFDTVCVLTNHDLHLLNKKGVSNAVRISNFSPIFPPSFPPLLTRNKWIIAIGSLTYDKGFERLLEIWALLYMRYPSWKLLIVGDGEEKDNLQSQIKDYGMSINNCEIIPPSKNISDLYARSQILASTSRLEGLPMVMIEALCFGCALISYDCETGPREIINHGISGYIIPNGQKQEYVSRLNDLLAQEQLRCQFSENAAVERIRYEPAVIVQEWIDIIEN